MDVNSDAVLADLRNALALVSKSERLIDLKWGWRPDDKEAPGSVYSERMDGHAYAVAMCPRYGKDDFKTTAPAIVAAVNFIRTHGPALTATPASDEAVGELPPLPVATKAMVRLTALQHVEQDVYTADQMRAYALSARTAAPAEQGEVSGHFADFHSLVCTQIGMAKMALMMGDTKAAEKALADFSDEADKLRDKRQAARLAPIAPDARSVEAEDDGSHDAAVWALIDLMKETGAVEDDGDEGKFLTLSLNDVYALEAALYKRNVPWQYPAPTPLARSVDGLSGEEREALEQAEWLVRDLPDFNPVRRSLALTRRLAGAKVQSEPVAEIFPGTHAALSSLSANNKGETK